MRITEQEPGQTGLNHTDLNPTARTSSYNHYPNLPLSAYS